MDESFILSLFQSALLAIFSAVLSFMVAAYWFVRKRDAEAAKALLHRIATLESQTAVAAQALQPISTAMQAILVKQLTHYHTPELDALLAKLDPFSLTPEEEIRLYHLLDERTRDMGPLIDASERNAAEMLPFVIKRVKEDTDRASEQVALQTVVVPMDVAETEPIPPTTPTVHNDPSADPADPAR